MKFINDISQYHTENEAKIRNYYRKSSIINSGFYLSQPIPGCFLEGDSYKKEAYYISIFQTDHNEQLRHILCQLEPSKMYWAHILKPKSS